MSDSNRKAQIAVEEVASFPALNPNPIIEADFQGHILYANPAAKKRFPDLDALGSTHPFLADWATTVESLNEKASEYYEKDAKVGEHWYHQQIILLPQSQTIRIYAFDITKRMKAEEALRESEERLMMAQKAAHVGTFEWNIQTGVNKWTPELELMYGLPIGGFKGTQDSWEQLVYHEDRKEAISRVSEAIEKGNFEGEWRVV